MKYSGKLLASVALLVVFPTELMAQTTENSTTTESAPPAEPQLGADANDIVVTARRRAERLQDVPVAVTAVTGAGLERQNVVNVLDLRRISPSLNISESPGSGRNMLQVTIRGQRQGDNLPSVDPSVGVYIGDVLFKRNYGLDQIVFDMGSVEVLKGPQGTLFGLNVTGGNLIFRPNLPKDKLEAMVKLGIGNYDARTAEAMINVPLGDKAAFRIAGQYRKRDGYIHNVNNPSEDFADQDGGGLRATLKLNPTDTLESVFTGDYAKQSVGGTGYKLNYVLPGSVADIVYNQQNCFGTPCPIFPIGYLNGQVALNNSIGFHDISNGQVNGNPFTNFAKLNYAWSAANTTSFKLTDDITLKNIVGYRKYKAGQQDDVDGSAAPLLQYGSFQQGNQFSDELQLAGDMGDLNWIVGAYYLRENNRTFSYSVNILSPIADATQNPYRTTDNSINTSKSIFGSVTKKLDGLVDGLSLTAGGRYTIDDRRAAFGTRYAIGKPAIPGFAGSGEHCGFDPAFTGNTAILAPQYNYNPATCLVDLKTRFKKFTYTVSADWKIDNGKLLYAVHRKGYRAGGFGTRAIIAAQLTPIQPEIVYDYEVGAKFDWRFDNGAFLRTNFALYHQDYKNIQRLTSFQQGFTTGTNFVNAQKATIDGVEAEVTFVPVSWLDLSGYASYTDAKFKKFIYDTNLDGTLDSDITSVAAFGGVPKWQIGASARVTLPTPDSIGKTALQLNYYRQSKFFLQDNTYTQPGGETPAYSLVNARLELNDIAGSPFSAAAFVNNLFDKNYVSARYVLTGAVGIQADIPGQPRFYGLEVKYSFGG